MLNVESFALANFQKFWSVLKKLTPAKCFLGFIRENQCLQKNQSGITHYISNLEDFSLWEEKNSSKLCLH